MSLNSREHSVSMIQFLTLKQKFDEWIEEEQVLRIPNPDRNTVRPD